MADHASPRTGLPPAALPALRRAYAGEVATRLPRLRRGAAALVAGAVTPLRDVVRDTHTLASSSALLGEVTAAAHARRAEALLVPFVDDAATAIPPAVARAAAAEVEALATALAGWLAPGAA